MSRRILLLDRWTVTSLFLQLVLISSRSYSAIVIPPNVEPPAPIEARPNPPQFARELRIGLHLDFVVRSVARYPNDDPARAVERYRAELGIDESGVRLPHVESASTETLESIPKDKSLADRPALYAAVDDIHPNESIPKLWFDPLNNRRREIANVLRSVGRIEVENYVRDSNNEKLGDLSLEDFVLSWAAGTGFVVADGVVMTNRHVARLFVDPSTQEFRRGTDGRQAIAWIDFAATRDSGAPRRLRLSSCLYIAPDDAPDVALFEIEGTPPDPVPLRLTTFSDDELRGTWTCVVCGHPIGNGELNDGKYLGVKAVKRASPGNFQVKRDRDRYVFVHDCSTSNGSSGSPLLDLESGQIVGIHRSGWGNSNFADPMWEIAELEEIRQYLPTPKEAKPVVPLAVADDPVPRPALSVCDGAVTLDGVAKTWRDPLEKDATVRTSALRSVGLLVLLEDSTVTPLGTAFVVAPGRLMTILPVTPSTAGKEFAMPALGHDYRIDFGDRCSTVDRSRVTELRRARLIYVSLGADHRPEPGFDIALFSVEGETPEPLRLDTMSWPDQLVGSNVFTVGFPFPDPRTPRDEQLAVFGAVFGSKFLAPGKISRNRDSTILHDCSTSGGCSGAPIIDFKSNAVVGVHYGGEYKVDNYARPMASIWSDPELRTELNGARIK